MTREITVVVVDDEQIIREGLTMILSSQPGLQVVAGVSDGEAAVEVCARTRPDVLLIDIRMPRRDGLWTLAELDRRGLLGVGRTQALVLTTFDLDEYVDRALAAGAAGFLMKNSSYEELAAAVRAVAAGHTALSPAVTRRIVDSHLTTRQPVDAAAVARLDGLTARELEVLRLIGEGLSNSEIADRLVVSTHTVKTHVSHVLAKTGCRTRGEAAVLARRTRD